MLAGDAAAAVPQVAMLSTDPETDLAAFQLAEKLRDTGVDIEFPTAGAIGKKLKKAARSNIKLAIILGGDELAKNTVQLRDLTTGTQTEIAMADLADVVAAALLAP
jgi:histidyl-tRNA synthetase